MSRARELGNLANANLLSGDITNSRVGLGSTTPTVTFDVTGIITTTACIYATAFYGDGSQLENIASAGIGTAISDTKTSPLNNLFYTNQVLDITASSTVDVPASAQVGYSQAAEIAVGSGSDLIIADKDELIVDVLGIGTTGTQPLTGAGGRVRADQFTNRAADGAPTFTQGLIVTGVTTTTSTLAKGLTGNPNISVTDVQVGGSTTITGNLTVKGTQSIINSQSLEVRDKTVGIGSTASPTDATANGAGIVVYGATPKNFTWGSSGTKWTLTGGGIDLVDATVAGVTTSGSYVGRHTNIPKNAKTGAYVLVAADAGQTISNTTGGVTVNNNVFAAGDAVTIYNDSGSNQTITQGTGVTLRKAGSATTGNLTLKGYGLVTIWFKLTSEAIASGNLA